MAFNPFSVFRRNQKTLFAILTVFIMIMFTLQFGPGDIFQRIPEWLSKRRSTGEVVATIDGSPLKESVLQQTRGGRTIANQFMGTATRMAATTIENSLRAGQGAAGQQTKEAVDQLLQGRQMMFSGGGGQQNLQIGRFFYERAGQTLGDLVSKEGTPKDDLDLARTGQQLIATDTLLLRTLNEGGYFGLPNRSLRDAFEFNLWQRKADKLGIHIDADTARDLVRREFYGQFKEADFKELEAAVMERKQGINKDRLYQALAEEFRVRAAVNIVLGPVAGRSPNPGLQAVTAPWEGFEFFREQTATATYGAIAVPVENYLDKVTGKPTESELTELFNKHRNDEPDPTKERPGLKEPRRLKFEFVEVRGDEPYYQTAATDRLAKGELHARLGLLLTAPVGPAVLTTIAGVVPANVPELALTQEYDDYRAKFKLEVDTNLFPSQFFGTARVIGPDVVKPGVLAGASAAAAGSLLTFGSPLTAPLLLEQRAAVENRNMRARVQASFLANPFVPGAGIGTLIGSTAAAAARMPQPLPLAVMKADLATRAKKDVAASAVVADFDEFTKQMTTLGAKKDKSDVRAYLDKFVKERGLKLGQSAAFQTQWSIEDDAGLAPVKAKLLQLVARSGERGLVRFGRGLFFEQDMRTGRTTDAASFYKPTEYPSGSVTVREGETSYVIWRTEEQKAEAPKSLDAPGVRAKVEAAWRKLKARELAKAAADDLAKKAGELSKVAGVLNAELRDLHGKFVKDFAPAAQERARYFLINDVAPLPPKAPDFSTRPGQTPVQPFALPPTADIPFPSQDIFNGLLKNKDKPYATTVVEADAGKNVFYTLTVLVRSDPTAEEYYRMAYPGLDGQYGGTIRQMQQADEGQKAHEQAVELLKAEFKVSKENAVKLAEKGDAGE